MSGGCPEGFDGLDCRKVHELLEDYLDADVRAEIVREVGRHLEACPDCTLHVDSVRKVIRLYREANEKARPVDIRIDVRTIVERARRDEGGNPT